MTDSNQLLIVDDSEDSRSYCEMVANMFDVEVLLAKNVDEALAILDTGVSPQTILLDLIMPGRRPEELVKRVKEDHALHGTKIVIMSALREVAAQTKKMGADACLRKPFAVNRFIRTMGFESITA